MAKGVWRTIKGRHVYIEEGQSLSDALNNTSWKNNKKEIKERFKKYQEDKNNKNNSLDPEDVDTLVYDKLNQEEEEYELYKKARENEDSIDPMTEWSTDWAALSDKYSERYEKEKRMKSQSLQNANEEGRRQRDAINKALADINNSEVKRKQFAEKYDTVIHDDGYVETIPKRTNSDYFGKEQYEKYGDALSKKYAGKNISKKIEDADKPNGLRTIAKEIGAEDEYEVVKALEGMSRNNKAREIDDSTYSINKNYPQLTRNGTLYNITDHKDEGYYKGISATGRSFVGKSKEKYKIENPNDASDWGWIEKEEYDKLTSQGKLTDEADIARRIRQGKMNKDDYFMNNTYYLGKEKEGYYVQFQDVQSNKYDDVTKYPNSSPRVSSHTLARVWKDGNIIYNNDGAKEGREKYTSRAKVAKFLEGEKSYSTLVQSYMNAGFSKLQAEALAKYQLRRRK